MFIDGEVLLKILLLFIGIMFGVNFPDIDIKFKFLKHRSWLTHSFIVPLFMIIFALNIYRGDLIYIMLGFAEGVAIHLCYDLFPVSYKGGALIKFPASIKTGKWKSIIYIFVSIILIELIVLYYVTGYIFVLFIFILKIYYTFKYGKTEKRLIMPLMMINMVYFIGIYLMWSRATYRLMEFVINYI